MTPSAQTPGLAILLVGNYSNRTGYAWNNIYRLFQSIALESHRHGLLPWVSFAKFEPPLDWKHADVFQGVIELSPAPSSIKELWKWMRAIKNHKIRYLYLTDQACWSFRYALFKLSGVRKIIVHSRVSVADPKPAKPDNGIRGALKWIASRTPFIQATRIYTVSDFVRNRLVVKAKVPSSRVVTIINGVDLERFAPSKRSKQPDCAVQIFCGGRATVHKGIGKLIEATALLRNQFGLSGFTVQYAGDGPDLSDFIELAESLDLGHQFKFLGELPNTEEQLHEADIVVVPSIWGDACPSSISEALAAGKPLIATRVGGVPELIGNEGAAIMVEPGDSAELAKAMAQLIKNPKEREELAVRGRHRAEQALDEQRYFAEVLRQIGCDIGITSFSYNVSPEKVLCS